MAPIDYVVLALLAGAVFFGLVATVGLLRLPGFFARTHAASKAETMSAVLALAAVAIVVGEPLATVKTALLLVFALLTGPTAAHAIARAANEEGIEPWTRDGADPAVTDASAGGASPATDGGDPASHRDDDGRAES